MAVISVVIKICVIAICLKTAVIEKFAGLLEGEKAIQFSNEPFREIFPMGEQLGSPRNVSFLQNDVA